MFSSAEPWSTHQANKVNLSEKFGKREFVHSTLDILDFHNMKIQLYQSDGSFIFSNNLLSLPYFYRQRT